jgi:hypothetical protein
MSLIIKYKRLLILLFVFIVTYIYISSIFFKDNSLKNDNIAQRVSGKINNTKRVSRGHYICLGNRNIFTDAFYSVNIYPNDSIIKLQSSNKIKLYRYNHSNYNFDYVGSYHFYSFEETKRYDLCLRKNNDN